MASSIYDDSSLDSNSSKEFFDIVSTENSASNRNKDNLSAKDGNSFDFTKKLAHRQLYGRVTRHPKSKTEHIFNEIHNQCRFRLEELIDPASMGHIFMGFTLCGKYFISYKEKIIINMDISVEYEVYIWRFSPGQKLKFISKHRIFKLLKGSDGLDEIMFLQFPTDPYKVICYGSGLCNPPMVFITIVTLPEFEHCKLCRKNVHRNDIFSQGWCSSHGFILHFMFSTAQPMPSFDPFVSLSYPDHLVINTGHYIHVLNISSYEPPTILTNTTKEEEKLTQQNSCNYQDTLSEISETMSDNFSTNSVVEAILEDFSEYDLEGNDCNKPFHELNISCEPLNVTGRSYHNSVVQKNLQTNKDYLFSVPQSSSVPKAVEKAKIDKKTAEKAYEFTEENEKCEKLSSFRKKRLADKKYEFSEDNTENIVPFHLLRRERRYFYRSPGRFMRSPEYCGSLFLSPRSSGRSPMQSPNSRNGQFSPNSVRHLYCPSVRNSPHHSKSPISPRESARKFNVYSPSLDSDCSDYDSKLILRQINNYTASGFECRTFHNSGLLVIDSRKEESARLIKKVVRRYSSADFETSSLVSGQSRDDYNIPIEIPLIVQNLSDQHLDIVPEYKTDQISETQIIISQRTFDCEQFVQRRAQKLCTESHLEFLHCEDYDIKLLHVCAIDGHILCHAVIKIGALKLNEIHAKPNLYVGSCIFTWNVTSDAFEVIEPPENCKLQLATENVQMLQIHIPISNNKKVFVMDFNCLSSKTSLRDYNNHYEVRFGSYGPDWQNNLQPSGYSTVSDSD